MFTKNDKLPYRNLGKTGLIVSGFAYGNGANSQNTHEENLALIKKCLELGINFFDTAEFYWGGKAETSLGKIFKELQVPREQIVISTKIWVARNASINSNGNTNRKHIKESIKASLQRLQMQYVDVVSPHSYDQNTPIEQICRGFHDIIEEGYAFYWGTSNWDADTVFEAFRICQKYNLHKPIAAQNQYNMFIRDQIEKQYQKLFSQYGYGLFPFNALLGGYLTGKYLQSDDKEKGRFNLESTGKAGKQFWKGLYLGQVDIAKIDNKLKELKVLAEKELQCKLVHLALAWSLRFKYTSSAIIGARNPEQLEDSFKALEVYEKLTPELEGKVNKILQTSPELRFNAKTWQPETPLRPVAKQ